MDNSDRSARIVRFGAFEADLQTGELRKSGAKVPLQGQPFQVCAILLQHPGELVTREELRRQVWPEDTFVDFDHALNTAITKIRLALGDNADNPRFVETLPRRGYRFIGSVEKPAPPPSTPPIPEVEPERTRTNRSWLVALTAFAVLISGVGIWRFSRLRTSAPLPPIEVMPLAGLAGFESDPAFSPDGSQVAFVLGNAESRGIYTTVVESDKSLRLTSSPADFSPTWSPDGRRVAFYRGSHDEIDIYSVSALGGSERRLYAGPSTPYTSGLDWSPDGKVLAFVEGQADKSRTWISFLSLDDSSIRPLTSPSGLENDISPAFSPDGSTVAFVRESIAGVTADIYLAEAAGGVPKRLTTDNTWILGSPAWTPDGRDIVYSSARGGLPSLWRVSASGGVPRPVAGVGAIAFSASVSRRNNRLVYQRMFFKDNIWRLDLKDEKQPLGKPVIVRSEKGLNWRPNFSPDGKRFAFESNGLGYAEIWACDRNGSNCGQLTSLRGTAGAPRWSPDGRYIAFEFRPKDHTEIYLLEVGGGAPRLLPTLPGADNGGPSWSRDGKSIYFYSDQGGEPFQLWKVPSEGGKPVQITKNGGVFGAESADGNFLYFSKLDARGIWKMPVQGGQEERVFDKAGGRAWYNWTLARNGIYFLDFKDESTKVVKFFDFKNGETVIVSTSDRPPGTGLALSNDGKSILYDDNELAESSLMLVKNFR